MEHFLYLRLKERERERVLEELEKRKRVNL